MERKKRRSQGVFQRVLNWTERAGNALPHPATLFALFALGALLFSLVGHLLGWEVIHPGTKEVVRPVNLLSTEGIHRILLEMVDNYTGFAPLGIVMVAMLGIGIAEKSGLVHTIIRLLVLNSPKRLLTFVIVFTGIISNVASDIGYVLLVPLAGVIFLAVGRHPIAGMAAAFAGVSGGYSANLLIGTVDPLLAGITQEAARLIDPDYLVHPAVNWYFMFVSTFLITGVGTWVTLRIVEPKLGPYDPAQAQEGVMDNSSMEPLAPLERRGLRWAGAAALAFSALLALAVVPSWGVLRDPATGDLLNSPFLRGMVALIFVFFFVPGVVYGRVTGSMKTDREVIDGMAAAMSTLGLYIVLVFFAAQFVAFFNWTNLGGITAVLGADLLISIGLTG